MLLIIWYLAAVPVLCNRLKINIMLLMTIYLINNFSILVLGSILMANNVVFVSLINLVRMCLIYTEINSRSTVPIQWGFLHPGF